MKECISYVYILTNKTKTCLYVGVTTNLLQRVYQHRTKMIKGFTSKYQIKYLVYFEVYASVVDAIKREKQLKRWRRQWKEELISKHNKWWKDLWWDIGG